jgi:hypothetical protein
MKNGAFRVLSFFEFIRKHPKYSAHNRNRDDFDKNADCMISARFIVSATPQSEFPSLHIQMMFPCRLSKQRGHPICSLHAFLHIAIGGAAVDRIHISIYMHWLVYLRSRICCFLLKIVFIRSSHSKLTLLDLHVKPGK